MSHNSLGYRTKRMKSQIVRIMIGQEDRHKRMVTNVRKKAEKVALILCKDGYAQITYPETPNEPSVNIEYDFEGPVDEEQVLKAAHQAGELFNQHWVKIIWHDGTTEAMQLMWGK